MEMIMSLSSVYWNGPGNALDMKTAYETSMIEVILNLLVKDSLLMLPAYDSLKSSKKDLKNYKISMHGLFNKTVKCLCCYRTKLNSKLNHHESLKKGELAIIEVYEYKPHCYELRRVSFDAYMKHQNLELEDLPPELMLCSEE
jgi:hypothetical protein